MRIFYFGNEKKNDTNLNFGRPNLSNQNHKYMFSIDIDQLTQVLYE